MKNLSHHVYVTASSIGDEILNNESLLSKHIIWKMDKSSTMLFERRLVHNYNRQYYRYYWNYNHHRNKCHNTCSTTRMVDLSNDHPSHTIGYYIRRNSQSSEVYVNPKIRILWSVNKTEVISRGHDTGDYSIQRKIHALFSPHCSSKDFWRSWNSPECCCFHLPHINVLPSMKACIHPVNEIFRITSSWACRTMRLDATYRHVWIGHI